MKSKINISCVVTLHAEGILAHRSLASIARAINFCRPLLTCELILILDDPDQATTAYVSRSPFAAGAKIRRVNERDPAGSRNCGISMAEGRFIAILDGDDLISENWLSAAHRIARRSERYVIHPEWNVNFGANHLLWRHPDQLDPRFSISRLIVENYWSALCFAHRDTFKEVPYEKTRSQRGIGYEDWHWNCETIAAGRLHTIAPDTVHFVRLKNHSSRNSAANNSNHIVANSSLFTNRNFWSTGRI